MLAGKVAKRGMRLALALIMGLALVGSLLPSPAQAQDGTIDLVLGGEGATSWDIDKIKPGDSGTKIVELHNAGSKGGFVTIWISDIQEVDYGGDGAGLGDYLLFNLSHERLSTNIIFPATIYELPQNVSDPNLIKISPLNAGETITLIWQWEFPEIGETQNEAQGDSLSFTINYMLEELPPAPGPLPGPEPGPPGYQWLKIDIMGEVTTVKVSSSGRLLQSVRAIDAQGQIALELDRGTKILCPGGKVPRRLEISTIQISPPQDTVVLDGVYRLDAYLYEYSESPCLFTVSPPGRLALSYDLSELPPNSLSLFTAYYDTQKGWVELSPGDITEAGELTVEISGALIFTIMVRLGPPPSPAEPCFRPSNLVIEPGEAKPGQEITISLTVANIGGAAGTCTLELKVDREVRSAKSIALESGESKAVSFSIIEDMEGEHIVEIADLSGDFSIVIISRPWWLLSTMGVIPIAVFAERRKRWNQRVEWSTGLKTKDWLVK
jgi:CARDB.